MNNRIVILILTVLILVSLAYVFWGKNWLAEQQLIQKYRNVQFVRNELMQRLNEIQFESQQILSEVLKQDYDISFFTRQKIELMPSWSVKVDRKPVCPPLFDRKHIYLAEPDKITVYDKNGTISWQRNFPVELNNALLTDANRVLLAFTNGSLISMDRDSGEIYWEKENFRFQPELYGQNRLDQISMQEYLQLEDTVVLIYSGRKLELLNNLSGQEVSSFITVDIIDSVSEFDLQERSIYLVTGNRLAKIRFEVGS